MFIRSLYHRISNTKTITNLIIRNMSLQVKLNPQKLAVYKAVDENFS